MAALISLPSDGEIFISLIRLRSVSIVNTKLVRYAVSVGVSFSLTHFFHRGSGAPKV